MDKSKLPKPFNLIIALLHFDDVPPIPAIGFIAPTNDTNEPYFHTLPAGHGFHIDIIEKWDYIEDVAPEYARVMIDKK